ncbi:Bug family tripartite tricarboxylate transporter substrate binding protein [Paraburkholderia monticola]|nr:tripartite tricarboxylate transporter substrate binding protein [Paraburkholderia monticola]
MSDSTSLMMHGARGSRGKLAGLRDWIVRTVASRALPIATTIATAVLMNWAPVAQAAYPDAPIRLIIAFPGGSSEAQGRILAQALGKYLGQPVIVQAQPGAGGNIAAAYVAKSRGDGYTILLGSNTFFETNPLMYRDIGYDLKDLKPVSTLSEQTYVLAVRPSLPIHSVQELIVYAQKNPGKLTNATAGSGSPVALAGMEFSARAGVRFLDVPYKGGGEDTMAVLSGFADLEFSGVTDVAAHVDAGKLRALAVTSKARAKRLPDVPTVAESGVAGYEFTTWNAVFVPTSTPAPIVERLHAAIVSALNEPEVQSRFEQIGFVPVSSTGEAAARRIATESAEWRSLFKQTGVTPN